MLNQILFFHIMMQLFNCDIFQFNVLSRTIFLPKISTKLKIRDKQGTTNYEDNKNVLENTIDKEDYFLLNYKNGFINDDSEDKDILLFLAMMSQTNIAANILSVIQKQFINISQIFQMMKYFQKKS